MLGLKKMSFAPAQRMNRGLSPPDISTPAGEVEEVVLVLVLALEGERPDKKEETWSATAGTAMVESGPVKPWMRVFEVVAPPTA